MDLEVRFYGSPTVSLKKNEAVSKQAKYVFATKTLKPDCLRQAQNILRYSKTIY